MRFLIAGLGSIGRRHLRNLISLGEKDILLYRTGKSTLPDDELVGFEVETDLTAALERRPDAVIVSNPTALHLDVAIPAARAGCHILLEKPVSDSMRRVDELRRSLGKGGGQLLVGFQFRQHPTLREAKRIIDAGDLGRPVSVRAQWGEYLPEWHPWEDHEGSYAARRDLGGGALLTLCHPFDYLRWIFGDVVASQGLFGDALGLEVEGVVEVVMRFRTGLLASVHLDYLQRPLEHSLEVVGESGRLRWDGRSGDLEVQMAPTWERQHHSAPTGFERNEMFVAEMKHFLQVAAGQTAPICPLEDGIRVQEIIEWIRDSASQGEEVGEQE